MPLLSTTGTQTTTTKSQFLQTSGPGPVALPASDFTNKKRALQLNSFVSRAWSFFFAFVFKFKVKIQNGK